MKNFLLLFSVILLLAGCKESVKTDPPATDTNPFLAEWDTPFGAPPFDKIEDAHYMAAFEIGMAEEKKDIQAIIDNKEAPTFENTIEAIESAGATLSRTSSVFYAVEGSHGNEAMREVAKNIAPKLSAHNDDIWLNEALFAKVAAVYQQREKLNLNKEQSFLLEQMHKNFVRSGANLDEAAKTRLREINGKLAEMTETFSQNVLAETNNFEVYVTNKEDLGNLPASLVASAADEAIRRGKEGGYVFTLSRPSINPFLQYSPNRELRKKLFMGYALKGDNGNANDNNEILSEIAALRAERAKLKGYNSHAEYILSDNMAENPKRTYELLDRVWEPALKVAKSERDALEAMMQKDGIKDDLKGWDWRYYTEKVRKEKYDFDEEQLRPYFEFTAVLDGAFQLATRLFGITFHKLDNMPTWHPDQQVYEVKEADGKHIGLIYMDFFTRESKRGGAWMNDMRQQSRLGGEVTPIVTNDFNFPPPTDDSPSLLSLDEAETLFHEFGHGLHGLFSDVTYASVSGTNTPRDFVEFPSQVMENWMAEPDVLRLFAKHYKTGELIPDELIRKISAASKFNQGFATVEYMAASYLDMAWHTITDTNPRNAKKFEDEEMKRIGLIEEIIPRYRSTYFNHAFSSDPGYSAGYYSYIWSEVLDADCFQAFKETSLFDKEVAARYRKLLSQGGSRPGMELYEEFRGRAPEIEPLLVKKGLN